MPLRLVLLIYNLLLPFVLLILLPASVLKMRRRGGYGSKFWQRFGFFRGPEKQRLADGAGRCLWIHAVSVGEVNVARKLIDQLLRLRPDQPIVLSVTTSTGYAVAVEKAPPSLTVIYSPVDLPPVVKSVLCRIRPVQFILVEAEVWPNLVHSARSCGVPVRLVNARLSPRSERRYRRFRKLASPVFGMLDAVMVQELEDVARWTGIGVPPDRIRVTGSVKYDQSGTGQASPACMEEFREILKTCWSGVLPRVVLAASTHAGEEQALGEIWQRLKGEFPSVKFLIAPRHAERRAEVRAGLEAAGLTVALRSLPLPPGDAPPDVLVVDSTGELRHWQALSQVVIIGKSFLANGGQNPAEAIAAGVPVLTGPHMENFTPLMHLLADAGGIRQVASLEQVAEALRDMLHNPDRAAAMAARGKAALDRHAGAAARTASLLLDFQ
ncbi:MAG: 3-deoxy-D-manno-octulosonic acid transferase [Verrucomicrobiales bacterium]|nr:3-deoxy-D-manno-octulosonic acid transferase [Verrucomicrobiales bacterium]